MLSPHLPQPTPTRAATVRGHARLALTALLGCTLLTPQLRAAETPAAAPPLPATPAASTSAAATPAADGFFFHDGDLPIEFIGDSITEQRMYTTLIESFVLSRYPQWHVTFRNVGWSGDTSWFQMRGGLANALARDLLPLAPRAATIDFGMNDARGGLGTLALYKTNLEALVVALQQSGTRVAVCSPSPEERYEAGQMGGSAYNQMLATYADAARSIAKAHQAVYADQFTPVIGVITRGRAAGILGAGGDPKLMYDGVHPNWGGHLVMAASILTALSAPSLVSSLTLDAKAGTVTAQAACHAEILPGPPAEDVVIACTRLDERLPWPLPSEAALVQTIPGFTPLSDLSQYDLTVSGLAPGSYQLLIDQEVVGTFSDHALADGVNLTAQCGPISLQMNQLLAAIQAKNNTYYERWRSVQLYAPPAWLTGVAIDQQRALELTRLDQAISDQEQAITALRQPHAHRFELRYAPPEGPHGLTIATVGATHQLRWEPPGAPAGAPGGANGITAYAIERARAGQPFSVVAQVPGSVLSYLDPTVDAGAAGASYRVVALAGSHRSHCCLGHRGDAPGSGWQTSFFSDTHLGTPTLERVDPVIDFTWSRDPPAPTLSRVNFSARCCGVITIPASGQYRFIATADDGVRVYLDGALLIDQWRDQGATECIGVSTLQAGSHHDLVVEYYQGGGDAVLKLEWQPPAGARAVLPSAAVAPAVWQP